MDSVKSIGNKLEKLGEIINVILNQMNDDFLKLKLEDVLNM